MTNFGIYKETYFYYGTFRSEPSGLMTSDKGDVILFGSEQEAKDFLFDKGIVDTQQGGLFYLSGVYELGHGEYDRPDFRIKKTRKSRGVVFAKDLHWFEAAA